jgi:hypothetical protein
LAERSCLFFEAVSIGMLLKDLAVTLSRFRINMYLVNSGILRINKHPEKEFGEHLVER